jgi:ribosomal protein S12 methylthiotransferase accessory factor
MAAGLRAGWMVGVVPAGLTVVGPEREVLVTLDGDARALTDAVAAGPGAAAPPGVDAAEHARLLELLDGLGAFGAAGTAPPGHALADALASARAGAPPAGVVWTAEEALVLPPELPVDVRHRALRAFLRGLRPDGRLQAYALAWRGPGLVRGDVPEPDALRAAGDLAPGTRVEVVELARGGTRWSVDPGGLERIGAHEPHRLGPITRAWPPEPVVAGASLWLCVAEVAAGSLDAPAPARDRVVQGVGRPEHARRVACAEGAERHASADLERAELVTARRSELPGALDPAALYAGAEPAGPGEDGELRPWCPAVARDGTRRWVPAEAVYTSVVPPGSALPWTGSGVAAHPDLAAARERALRELIERDAFMWTWLQRVSRERVAPGSVPPDVGELAALLTRHGWTTTWVDLSLDTLPVLLCGLTHEREGLTLGAACHPDPVRALRRATEEALVLALRLRTTGEPRPAARAVRTPYDHLLYHRDPARWAEHGFLLSSPDTVDLGDIPGAAGADAGALLDGIGHSPLTVDLTLSASAPFRVVRALAPGLLPLTFGWGAEPVGLARACSPRATRDGRRVGTALARKDVSGMVPHPFP